jgi:sigma-B regulation protein RsbU (phosphoserine phosphatase)
MPTISDRDLQRLRHSVEELSALNQIALAINTTMPVQDITQTILQHCIKRINAQQGAVYLLHDETADKDMFLTFVRAQDPEDTGLPIHLSKSLIGWMIGHRRVLAVNDPDTDDHFQGIRFRDFGIESLLVAPLLSRKGLTGVLALFNSTRPEGFVEEDMRFLGIVGTQTAKVIENAQLVEQEKRLQAYEEEMRLARIIQSGYIPRQDWVNETVHILGYNKPARDVGGDFYDICPIGNDRVFLSLGDVSGKGVPAALMASGSQAILRALLRGDPNMSLSQLAESLNGQLAETTRPEQFLTLFMAVYDGTGHTVSYVNAGHVPPGLIRASGDIGRLTGGGPLVGVLDNPGFEVQTVEMTAGDTLFVCSDGVTENFSADLEEFGDERVCRFLAANCTRPPSEIRSGLIDELSAFRGGAEQSDDITFVLVRRP